MNFYKHHIGDYAAATAHLSFVEDAAYTRLLRIYYRDEGALPAELKAVQRLAGARSRDEKEAIQTVLEEFFTLESDGWHNKRCDEEIEAQRDVADEREEKKVHERERKRRYRARRAELFEALRDKGIVPPFDTSIEDLERMLSQGTDGGTSQGTDGGQVRGRPQNGTAIHKPEARSQISTPEGPKRAEESQSARTFEPEPSAQPEPPRALDPTAAGRACLAMRRGGIAQTNPSHPSLLAAIAEGATDEAWEHTAREAASHNPPRGFAWVIATIRGRLADAARQPTGAPHAARSQRDRRSLADQVLMPGDAGGDPGTAIAGTATRIAHR